MLVILATIDFDPSKREAAHAAMIKMQNETHKEPGCHVYAFTAALDNPGRVHISEQWESEEALRAHFATPHMAEFQTALKDIGVTAVDATKHQVSSSGPVR